MNWVEVNTYYISNTHERVVVVNGKVKFRGPDRFYIQKDYRRPKEAHPEDHKLQRTPVYYWEEAFVAGLSIAGINFSHNNNNVIKDEDELDEILKEYKDNL